MKYLKSVHRQNSIKIIPTKNSLSVALMFALFFAIQLNAQSPPTPPEPPKTVTSTGTSYSISIDNDDDETSNSSVSISVSDDAYKFRARYHESKNDGVKAILLKTLGRDNLKISGSTYVWSDGKKNNEVFECKLTDEHLRMYVDADFASEQFLEKIQGLGTDLKYYISGTSAEKEREKAEEKAQKALQRAQREVERAQRDVERAKRNAERAKGN